MEIEELKKVNRSERYLELGAAVTLSNILKLTRVPQALREALKQSAPLQIRNMATIGGSIASENRDLFPVFHLLDAQLEIRGGAKKKKRFWGRESHWLPFSRFTEQSQGLALEAGQILTKIRIPDEQWSCQSYCRTEGISSPLLFTGLANLDKYVITDFRICFSTAREAVIRNREMEADLIGRRLPLTKREINHLTGRIEETFTSLKETGFTAARAKAQTLRFLNTLEEQALAEEEN